MSKLPSAISRISLRIWIQFYTLLLAKFYPFLLSNLGLVFVLKSFGALPYFCPVRRGACVQNPYFPRTVLASHSEQK